jgi:hypothetical protein
MDHVFRTHERNEKMLAYKINIAVKLKGTHHLEGAGTEEGMILKWIAEKQVRGCGFLIHEIDPRHCLSNMALGLAITKG